MRKILYGVKSESYLHPMIYEFHEEAEKSLEELSKNYAKEKFSIFRFIYKTKHCTHCGHYELMTMIDNTDRKLTYYQCPDCDSTYTKPAEYYGLETCCDETKGKNEK